MKNKPPELQEAEAGQRPVIIYPAARMAAHALPVLQSLGFHVIGFGDGSSERIGQRFHDLPIYSAQAIAEMPEVLVLVATSLYNRSICALLRKLGCSHFIPMPLCNHWYPSAFISREYEKCHELATSELTRQKIETLAPLIGDDRSKEVFSEKHAYFIDFDPARLEKIRSLHPIYFEPGLFQLTSQELIADCGAYTGDTLREFIFQSHGLFNHYYAFEPDFRFGRLILEENIPDTKLTLIKAGVSNRPGHFYFESTGSFDGHGVRTASATTTTLDVVALDDYFKNLPHPTFIKMDIEGMELLALEGAQDIIRQSSPLLAISIYHEPSHLWEIPLLLHRLNPDYRFYVGHYSCEIDDTVCYAVPSSRRLNP